MSSLHDELVAKSTSSRCITCRFLSGLSPKERAVWETELKITTIPNEAFAQAISKRGTRVTDGAVRDHRRNHQ